MMYSSPYLTTHSGTRSPQVRTSATNTALYTPVGQLVGAATSPELKSVDRSLNASVVRAIGNYATGPQEALEAINYRLSLRMSQVNILTLVLLQSCMIACGERFHMRAIHSETIRCIAMVCTLKSKVGALACEMLQIWYASFLEVADQYRPLYEVYAGLRMDEIEFPKIDPGRVIVLEKKQATPLPTSEPTSGPVNKNLNSITSHTTPPQRSGSTQDSSQLTQQHQSQQSQAQGTTKSGNGLTQHHRASKTTSHTNSTAQQNTQAKPRPTPKSVILAPGQTRPPNTKVLLRDDQLAKARDDLSLVASHVDLLLALLTQVPADISPTTSALLVNVYNNAKQMRTKIHYLVQRIDHRELKEELQRASDKLTVAFEMYDHAVVFAERMLEDRGDGSSGTAADDEGFLGSDSETTRSLRKLGLEFQPKHQSMTNLLQKENVSRRARGVDTSFKYKRSESLPSFDVINTVTSKASRTSSEMLRQRRTSLTNNRLQRKSSTDDLTEVKF